MSNTNEEMTTTFFHQLLSPQRSPYRHQGIQGNGEPGRVQLGRARRGEVRHCSVSSCGRSTVPRHTYHHIRANKWFTLNTLHPDFLEAAHQTSANYDLKASEFAATGLTPEYSDRCKAPYVKESPIKLGLTLEEEYPITANGTIFLIGRVQDL